MSPTLLSPHVRSHLPPPPSTAGGERRVRNRRQRRRVTGLADAAMLALSGAAAVLAAPASAVSRDGMSWALAYLLATLVVLELRGFYDFRLHRSPVEPEAPVLDVPVVPLHAIGERGLAPEPLYLSPAGESRLDPVAVGVAVDVLLEGAHERRALGARRRRRTCRPPAR